MRGEKFLNSGRAAGLLEGTFLHGVGYRVQTDMQIGFGILTKKKKLTNQLTNFRRVVEPFLRSHQLLSY
jgi:hypothetical protein